MPATCLHLTHADNNHQYKFRSQSLAAIIIQVNQVMQYVGLGYAMVITNTLIALYYCIIIGWSMFYLFASMTTQLPWEHCGNWWNTPLCFESKDLFNSTGNKLQSYLLLQELMIKLLACVYWQHNIISNY